jgi:hypothetical protein
MADYELYGDKQVAVPARNVQAAAEAQLKTLTESPALSPAIKLSDVTVPVNENGQNVQPVMAEVIMPKPKLGEMIEDDLKPEVQSKVDNNILGSVLTAAGFADKAEDLRTLDQAMRLDNAGGREGPEGREKDPRLAYHMNMLHRQSADLLGLSPKPNGQGKSLEDMNEMNSGELSSLIQVGRSNNPALGGRIDLSPKELKQVNQNLLQQRAETLQDPDQTVRIPIGMTGLNFRTERNETIEKDPEFVPVPEAQFNRFKALQVLEASYRAESAPEPDARPDDPRIENLENKLPPSVVMQAQATAGVKPDDNHNHQGPQPQQKSKMKSFMQMAALAGAILPSTQPKGPYDP